MGRRRDLWLQCHSEKCVMRMIKGHYDSVAWEAVPSSQAGFTAGRNAPEQTLAARLMTEASMMQRTTCAKGWVDAGTFFMSIVNEIQWEVERWSKVAPSVTAVVKALREGGTRPLCTFCFLDTNELGVGASQTATGALEVAHSCRRA